MINCKLNLSPNVLNLFLRKHSYYGYNLQNQGTGSYPPLPQGWHDNIRRVAK